MDDWKPIRFRPSWNQVLLDVWGYGFENIISGFLGYFYGIYLLISSPFLILNSERRLEIFIEQFEDGIYCILIGFFMFLYGIYLLIKGPFVLLNYFLKPEIYEKTSYRETDGEKGNKTQPLP